MADMPVDKIPVPDHLPGRGASRRDADLRGLLGAPRTAAAVPGGRPAGPAIPVSHRPGRGHYRRGGGGQIDAHQGALSRAGIDQRRRRREPAAGADLRLLAGQLLRPAHVPHRRPLRVGLQAAVRDRRGHHPGGLARPPRRGRALRPDLRRPGLQRPDPLRHRRGDHRRPAQRLRALSGGHQGGGGEDHQVPADGPFRRRHHPLHPGARLQLPPAHSPLRREARLRHQFPEQAGDRPGRVGGQGQGHHPPATFPFSRPARTASPSASIRFPAPARGRTCGAPARSRTSAS